MSGFFFAKAASAAPTLVSATILADGVTLREVWIENIAHGAGGSAGAALTGLSGGATTLSSPVITGTQRDLTISRTVLSTETGGLYAYTQPGDGVEAAVGGSDAASFSGTAVTNNSTQSGGPTYFIDEGFEGVGAPAGWGGYDYPDWNYSTSPIVGSESLNISSGTLRRADLPALGNKPEIWGRFRLRINSLTAGGSLLTFSDSSYNTRHYLEIDSTGHLKLYAGGSAGFTTDALSAGVDYYVWFRAKKGTGADAIGEVFFSTTSTRPARGTSKHAEQTDGWFSSDLEVGAFTNANGNADIVLDDVKMATTEIS